MDEKKIRVAITHGDTNGIGYEIILKAFEDPMMLELCVPIIYGSPKIASYHSKSMGLETSFTIIANASEAREGKLNLLTCFDEETKVDIGQPTEESARGALVALEHAVKDQQEGLVDVVVLGPSTVNERLTGSPKVVPIRISDELRVALVTNGLAIRDVADSITKPIIVEKTQLIQQALKRNLRISAPRIAIMALNPATSNHEESTQQEEHAVIKPAIDELESKGVQAFGPYPADSFFGSGAYSRFDCVLAMYYDQGVTPLKSLTDTASATLMAGLPFVCTAPDQSPCFDTAGKGTADEAPLRNAVYLAIDCYRNQTTYDEAGQNPLPKLYHEKRDESEKVRFAVSKNKTQG